MSDIVERLRDRNNPENRWKMRNDAADEIERLWAMAQCDEKSYQAEIERLREHLRVVLMHVADLRDLHRGLCRLRDGME